jgi:hypothetical protein
MLLGCHFLSPRIFDVKVCWPHVFVSHGTQREKVRGGGGGRGKKRKMMLVNVRSPFCGDKKVRKNEKMSASKKKSAV